MDGLPFELIDWYALRMTIKYTIKSAIDYFYMGARPSATNSMKLDPELQTKLIVSGLCRISGTRLGRGWEDTQSKALQEYVGAEDRIIHSSSVLVDKRTIHVCW